MAELQKFLSECEQIVAQHAEVIKNKQKRYNIYQLLNVTNKEVKMCRILADMLDPDGAHGEGIKYLKAFFETVLQKEIPDHVLQEAKVYREFPIANKRRIDIVIEYQEGFIPIEVKINAGDMKSQCYDYYYFARDKDPNTRVIYLTRNGYKPSAWSLTGENGDRLDDKNILCISFDCDILNWLEKIKGIANDYMAPLIEQFEGAVRDFVNTEEEEYKMELTQKIIDNSSNLRTSIEISKTLNRAKAELMKRLFIEFEKQMEPLLEKYNLEPEKISKWFHYTEQASEEFYTQKKFTCPGINYVVSSVVLRDELSLWFRIEIEEKLFACLCVFDYSADSDYGYEIGNECNNISDALWEKLRQHVNLPEEKNNIDWIVTRKYLPAGTDDLHNIDETVPDFMIMNEAAIELADEDKRRDFVTKCIAVIEDKILSLIKP